jgi:hypothetical protein
MSSGGRVGSNSLASQVLGRVSISSNIRSTTLGSAISSPNRCGRRISVNREWEQPFTARLLDEPALLELLARDGLSFDRWLDRPGWFVASPAGR